MGITEWCILVGFIAYMLGIVTPMGIIWLIETEIRARARRESDWRKCKPEVGVLVSAKGEPGWRQFSAAELRVLQNKFLTGHLAPGDKWDIDSLLSELIRRA